MGISITEYIKINNVNEKTARLAAEFAEYIAEPCGLGTVELTADGVTAKSGDYKRDGLAAVFKLCKGLEHAREIEASVSTFDRGGFAEREEREYVRLLTSDAEIAENVIYRSYDAKRGTGFLDLALYEGGTFKRRAELLSTDSGSVADISEWYAENAVVDVIIGKTAPTAEISAELSAAYEKLFSLTRNAGYDDMANYVEDCNYTGDRFRWESYLYFSAANAAALQAALQSISDIAAKHGYACRIELGAASAAITDYEFAVLEFYLENGRVSSRSARF